MFCLEILSQTTSAYLLNLRIFTFFLVQWVYMITTKQLQYCFIKEFFECLVKFNARSFKFIALKIATKSLLNIIIAIVCFLFLLLLFMLAFSFSYFLLNHCLFFLFHPLPFLFLLINGVGWFWLKEASEVAVKMSARAVVLSKSPKTGSCDSCSLEAFAISTPQQSYLMTAAFLQKKNKKRHPQWKPQVF